MPELSLWVLSSLSLSAACHLKLTALVVVCACFRTLMSLAVSERRGRRETCSKSKNPAYIMLRAEQLKTV